MENNDYRRNEKYSSIEELAKRNFLNGYIELKGLSLTQEQFDELEKLITTRRFYIITDTKLCTDGFIISEDRSNIIKK